MSKKRAGGSRSCNHSPDRLDKRCAPSPPSSGLVEGFLRGLSDSAVNLDKGIVAKFPRLSFAAFRSQDLTDIDAIDLIDDRAKILPLVQFHHRFQHAVLVEVDEIGERIRARIGDLQLL